uniref:Peptidase A1 domain-containing protein n=1 Tax=Oryza punctata TaxID=4537 RepID=A0A0E0MA72_ORYPU
MGRPVAALLSLCVISLTTCSLSWRAAALGQHGLRRGLDQAFHGRLLADATAGGAAVPMSWSRPFYVVNFTIGTPPQPASGIIDLTGDFIWTQCATCRRCFKQELPLFNRSASSTFKPEPCGSDRCKAVPTNSCSSDGVCGYEAGVKFGDTLGIGGTDTVDIGTATASLVFGCVEESDFETMWGPSGVVGLAGTPWSLVSQMNASAFSYCLEPPNTGKNSRLFLGSSAKLAGDKSTSTPFVKSTSPGDDWSPYYRVQLEGIKAGDVVIPTPRNASTVLVHTFSPFSYLVDDAYQVLRKAVAVAIGGKTAPKPLEPYDLCFPKAGFSSANAPDLVFTFQGAAALTVRPSSYLIPTVNDTVCLAIMSSAQLNLTGELVGLNTLGSLQQENVHFLFDLKQETLSFEPADCSSLT